MERDHRITTVQKDILVEFMLDNIDFARNKLIGSEDRIQHNNLWAILLENLNAAGPKKEVKKWQRVWSNLKGKVRRKVTSNQINGKLTYMEKKILLIIGSELISEDSFPKGTETCLEDETLLEDPLDTKTTSENLLNPDLIKAVVKLEWIHSVEDVEVVTVDHNYISPTKIGIPINGLDQEEFLGIVSSSVIQSDAGNIDTVQQATPKQHTRSRKTYAAIKNVAEEIRNLNSKIDDIRKQNQEIQRQKKDTNLLLERIARALENKK